MIRLMLKIRLLSPIVVVVKAAFHVVLFISSISFLPTGNSRKLRASATSLIFKPLGEDSTKFLSPSLSLSSAGQFETEAHRRQRLVDLLEQQGLPEATAQTSQYDNYQKHVTDVDGGWNVRTEAVTETLRRGLQQRLHYPLMLTAGRRRSENLPDFIKTDSDKQRPPPVPSGFKWETVTTTTTTTTTQKSTTSSTTPTANPSFKSPHDGQWSKGGYGYGSTSERGDYYSPRFSLQAALGLSNTTAEIITEEHSRFSSFVGLLGSIATVMTLPLLNLGLVPAMDSLKPLSSMRSPLAAYSGTNYAASPGETDLSRVTEDRHADDSMHRKLELFRRCDSFSFLKQECQSYSTFGGDELSNSHLKLPSIGNGIGNAAFISQLPFHSIDLSPATPSPQLLLNYPGDTFGTPDAVKLDGVDSQVELPKDDSYRGPWWTQLNCSAEGVAEQTVEHVVEASKKFCQTQSIAFPRRRLNAPVSVMGPQRTISQNSDSEDSTVDRCCADLNTNVDNDEVPNLTVEPLSTSSSDIDRIDILMHYYRDAALYGPQRVSPAARIL